mmetsp:Transcript_64940/g.120886  ORF Transcript_64940/g.120886 Transcript_64940/m.120886 type:complete len:300 (-) Transcript_64940:427-1326(-)
MFLQSIVDICCVVCKVGLIRLRLIPARKATTDVEKFHLKALAFCFIPHLFCPLHRTVEGTNLGATAADVETHSNHLEPQKSRMCQQIFAPCNGGAEFVRQWAQCKSVVGLNTDYKLRSRINLNELIKFRFVVEDELGDAHILGILDGLLVLARIRIQHILARLDASQVQHQLHFCWACCIETSIAPLLPDFPKCFEDGRLRVALHCIHGHHPWQMFPPRGCPLLEHRHVQQGHGTLFVNVLCLQAKFCSTQSCFLQICCRHYRYRLGALLAIGNVLVVNLSFCTARLRAFYVAIFSFPG